MLPLGQLIISGISGTSLTDEEKKFIEEKKLGGIILFKKNFQTREQLAQLINDIQSLRDEWPLFISVDHEGGRVIRFREHFTQFPPMLEVAKSNSPKHCYEIHKTMALELKEVGVNLSYSPVCDLLTNPKNNVIGDRAFGDDPLEVCKYISAAVRGLQANNILSCAKHFPGHGDTIDDSHFKLPTVNKDLEELLENEFLPFRKAVKARTEFIMMAHLMMTKLDNILPSSLSPRIYQILREQLKYNKIIITDDMEMKAISADYSMEDAALKALSAGGDMLIFRNFETSKRCFNSLENNIKTKELKNSIIERKLERINNCKKNFLKNYKPVNLKDHT